VITGVSLPTIPLSTIINAGFEVKMTSIRVLDVSVTLVGWVISCFIFRLVHKLFNVLELGELKQITVEISDNQNRYTMNKRLRITVPEIFKAGNIAIRRLVSNAQKE